MMMVIFRIFLTVKESHETNVLSLYVKAQSNCSALSATLGPSLFTLTEEGNLFKQLVKKVDFPHFL